MNRFKEIRQTLALILIMLLLPFPGPAQSPQVGGSAAGGEQQVGGSAGGQQQQHPQSQPQQPQPFGSPSGPLKGGAAVSPSPAGPQADGIVKAACEAAEKACAKKRAEYDAAKAAYDLAVEMSEALKGPTTQSDLNLANSAALQVRLEKARLVAAEKALDACLETNKKKCLFPDVPGQTTLEPVGESTSLLDAPKAPCEAAEEACADKYAAFNEAISKWVEALVAKRDAQEALKQAEAQAAAARKNAGDFPDQSAAVKAIPVAETKWKIAIQKANQAAKAADDAYGQAIEAQKALLACLDAAAEKCKTHQTVPLPEPNPPTIPPPDNKPPEALPPRPSFSPVPAPAPSSAPALPPAGGSPNQSQNQGNGGKISVPQTSVPTVGDASFMAVQPESGDQTPTEEQAFAPPTVSAGGTMVTSVIDPNETGPQGVVVTEVDQNGEKKTFKTFTNAAGILAMVAPAAAALISLDRVNPNGSITPMTNTEVIPAATETSSQAPTITETRNTVEMTGTNPGLVTLHATGINPTATVPYIDNQPMTLRAASDTSVVATVPAGTSIGTHTFSVASEGVQSNKLQSDVITVIPEPLAVMHTGSVTNLTIDVAGIPEKHNPMVHVDVHGAAHFVDGGSSADIPVVNGKATAKIRADHPGQVTANYVVRSNIPGNSSRSTSSNTPKMPSKGVPVSKK